MAGRSDERQALLKLEAAKQLKCQRGGAWGDIRIVHTCGSADALEVTFVRDRTKFFARLLAGEIVELEAFPSKTAQ